MNVLEERKRHHLISCGGGVVELLKARQVLRSHSPVVHVWRALPDILTDLARTPHSGDPRRPNYGESIRSVWQRRREFYEEVWR